MVMYHYVKDDSYGTKGHSSFLTLTDFKKQLDYFQSSGNIIHPLALLSNDFVPGDNDFLLTFDDGLSDHFDTVFPELKKRQLSGLFFINGSNYHNRRLLNVHRLHYLLANHYDAHFEEHCLQLINTFPLNDHYRQHFESKVYEGLQHDSAVADIKRVLNFFMLFEDQDKVLGTLMQLYNVHEEDIAPSYYITPDQMKLMAEADMCFGAHGYTHYVLSNLPCEKQEEEIESSLSFVKSILPHQPVSFFCYPYGYRESFNGSTIEAVQSAGFKMAFSVENRPVSVSDWERNKFHLPRIDCNRFL